MRIKKLYFVCIYKLANSEKTCIIYTHTHAHTHQETNTDNASAHLHHLDEHDKDASLYGTVA